MLLLVGCTTCTILACLAVSCALAIHIYMGHVSAEPCKCGFLFSGHLRVVFGGVSHLCDLPPHRMGMYLFLAGNALGICNDVWNARVPHLWKTGTICCLLVACFVL